ncbi:hypothetical protein BJ138DRAFT_1017842 [Hygrophoropsis aurantiaca]|uniref:Uncharacterized protein n=1 Tax=Hygrophoropsis aurantiaca TaxID=72124 RepID=A0ACB7ZWT3_9AGAM|nr:hypothetical protein BJ138DRAFT_1017842 [Hygrophoropsis aurantiaca]
MVHDGTVFPYDKKVLVTNTVSTVVQFQAIDWGMEICELHLDIPQSITTSTSAHRTSANLVLYRLNATHRLDITSLSYHNRPSRVSKLANLHLGLGDVTASDNIIFSEGVRWHRRFACTTDEVLSFELGCAVSPEVVESEAESCHVEWWQNRDKKTPCEQLRCSFR